MQPYPPIPVDSSPLYQAEWRVHLPTAVRAEGIYVYDSQGNAYMDAVGGAFVVSIGYGVGEIATAMAEQAQTLSFAYANVFSNGAALRLAQMVLEMAPAGFARVYFVSGGSEANEVAIKFARKYQLVKGRRERWRVITRWPSYHGATMATLAASGHASRRADYEPFLLDFPHVSLPYAYAGLWRDARVGWGARCADELEERIEQVGAHTVAAFLCEPISGLSAGAVVPPPDYFDRIREICDRHDILLIADEIITGFGRTGTTFALDHWGVVPDLITCGKAISSGYAPLGAVVMHRKVTEAFAGSSADGLFTGHTYSGHPVSCAAGVAVLRYLHEHQLVERARSDGGWFLEQVGRLSAHPAVGDVRGRGMLVGIEFVQDKGTRSPLPPDVRFSERVVLEARKRKVIVLRGRGTRDGIRGEHILLSPPLITSRDELRHLVQVMDEAISAAEQHLRVH